MGTEICTFFQSEWVMGKNVSWKLGFELNFRLENGICNPHPNSCDDEWSYSVRYPTAKLCQNPVHVLFGSQLRWRLSLYDARLNKKEATVFFLPSLLPFPTACPATNTSWVWIKKISDVIFTSILLSRLFVVSCAVQIPHNLWQENFYHLLRTWSPVLSEDTDRCRWKNCNYLVFVLAFPDIRRSFPPPNVGPILPSQQMTWWFLVLVSGNLVGPWPCGLTMLNMNAWLHVVYPHWPVEHTTH